MALSQNDIVAIQEQEAAHPELPPGLLMAIASQETGGEANPDTAVSPTGAVGLFQILPSTARQPGYGVSPFQGSLTDPGANAAFAANYLSARVRAAGSVAGGVSGYSGNSYSLASLEARYPQYFGNALNIPGKGGSQLPENYPPDQTTPPGAYAPDLPSLSGIGGFIWEVVERAGIVGIGLGITLLALFFLFWQASGVSVPARILKAAA